jgi:hypothetical protein
MILSDATQSVIIAGSYCDYVYAYKRLTVCANFNSHVFACSATSGKLYQHDFQNITKFIPHIDRILLIKRLDQNTVKWDEILLKTLAHPV